MKLDFSQKWKALLRMAVLSLTKKCLYGTFNNIPFYSNMHFICLCYVHWWKCWPKNILSRKDVINKRTHLFWFFKNNVFYCHSFAIVSVRCLSIHDWYSLTLENTPGNLPEKIRHYIVIKLQFKINVRS